MNRTAELIAAMGEASILEKLAEECGELTAAALKLNGGRRGESPMTERHAKANLIEETADVLVMIRLLRWMLNKDELAQLNLIASQKERRMYERLLKEVDKSGS